MLVRVFPGQSTHCKDPIVQFNKVLKLIDKNGQKCLLCESEGTHCDCMCSNRLFRTALWGMELYKRVGIGLRGRKAAISRCKPQKGCTRPFFTSILCISLEFTLCIRVIFPFTFCQVCPLFLDIYHVSELLVMKKTLQEMVSPVFSLYNCN